MSGTQIDNAARSPAPTPLNAPASGAPAAEPWYHGLGPTAILAALWTVCPAVLGLTLLAYLGPVATWLKAQPLGWGVYVLVFILSAGVGFLPTYGQSMLGGFTFNFGKGFPGAMLGFVGGSVIGYHIAKGWSKHRVEEVLERNPKARAAREALIGHGFWRTVGIVTLIRLPPNSPFALTNLVLESSGVSLGAFLLGTALGMAPRTAIAVWLADKANDSGAKDIAQIIKNEPWWHLALGVGLLVLVLALLGAIANHAIGHVTGNGRSAPGAN